MNLNDSKNYVHVVTDVPIEGQNSEEVHSVFHSAFEFSRLDVFTSGGSTYRGSWVADGGDLAAPANTRERRLLCILGRASFTFTGTSISLRTSLNPGWGLAHILIDGVKPSTIPGLTTALDVVSCESEALGSWGNEYIDQVVADNLAPGTHTIELSCIDNSATQFFVFSGAKVYDYTKKIVQANKWSIAMADREQPIGLKFKVTGPARVINATATFNSLAVDPVTKAPLGTVNIGSLIINQPSSIAALPQFTGSENSDIVHMPVTLAYQIEDPAGTIPVTGQVPYDQADPSFTYVGPWWVDPPTEGGYPETARACASRAAWFTFLGHGDSFTIRVYTDFGMSPGVLLKDVVNRTATITSGLKTVTLSDVTGISVGMRICHQRFASGVTVASIAGNVVTMSAKATGTTTNANMAFGTYVQDIVTHEVNESLQRTFQNKTVSGLGANYSGRLLIQCNSTAGFAWNTITMQTTIMYSAVTDNISLDFTMKQVPPAAIDTIRLQDGRVEYDVPDHQAHDLLSAVPFDNRHVTEQTVEYRFPTFICCYTSGYLDLFKQYDIVITDPGAYTYNEIQELRDLGIRVYLYVSFGEEDGRLLNKWDVTSPQGPHTGDGTGPGGTAGYYMKGGYNYGEFSECSLDRQRLEGVKACAVNNPKYYVGTGRCTMACGHDWRTGYTAWQEGGQCGAGFTSANNWIRNASTACSNNACPSFAPLHQKCPQYIQAENVWGQDFSMLEVNTPDENGIWSSYYIDAVKRGPGSWHERLQQYYLPLVFGQPTAQEDVVLVTSNALTDARLVLGFQVLNAPIDEGFPFSVKDTATGFVYEPNRMYSFDKMQGTFVFAAAPGDAPVGYVVPYVGQSITVNYTKRALDADGVFMDTVDTVDVYPRADYQQGFADLINDLKLEWPEKGFCSNRGFSIYDKMIHSCDLIMTESVFSHYNFNDGTYSEVSEAAAAWNAEVTRMIQELRKQHVFDVVCLNYAPNGPEGDAIRASVQEKTLALGWMPWLSTILLNDPLPANRFQFTKGYIRANEWRRIRALTIGD